jgi:Flp pilus assembly protein TadD
VSWRFFVLATVVVAVIVSGFRLQAEGIFRLKPEATAATGQDGAPVTFTEHVGPLIIEKCGACHRPDGAGPFSLLKYEDVRRRATQIVAVTESRFMPPWKAEPGYGEFVGQHPLTDAEIGLIRRWATSGAREGPPRELPTPKTAGKWQLGTPDLVVRLPESFLLPAEGADVFRTFVIRLPVNGTRFVRGLEFQPDNPRVVHHANIRIDRTPTSRALDEQDPAPGHDGMARSAEFPDGHFLAWAPGQVAPLLPQGLAWQLDPGTDLVIQFHMRPSGKPEPVAASVGLFFDSAPPARKPVILRLGRQDIDIPAGDSHHTIVDSYVLPVDAEVLSVQPHAHYRGREIQGFATLPDGTTKWLIYIRDWDFRWQHVYRLVTPIMLPRGTSLTMRYTFDNSVANVRNPTRPPVRARYGWKSEDEMAELYVQVFTRDDRDRTELQQAFNKKVVAEDIVGYQSIIARNPPNVALLHDDVAFLYLQLGNVASAIAHFEAAIGAQPDRPDGYFNLGTALRLAGRFDEAVAQYQRAIRLRPGYMLAYSHLGALLLQLGRADEALEAYRQAVSSDPRHAGARNNLGSALMQRGALQEAEAHFREALRLDPAWADAHYNLAHVLKSQGRSNEAASHLEEAARLTAP